MSESDLPGDVTRSDHTLSYERAWEYCVPRRTQRSRHRRRDNPQLQIVGKGMDLGSYKLLESATHRTLHAHSFSRASSQASHVLTDLLSRYLTLLSSTCAKYAHHAGRTDLSASDAIGALDELGLGLEELTEYCSSEGKELGRYAIHSARRVEDMNEFKGQLGCTIHPTDFYLILSSSTRRRSKARS
jgi:histone H3/H4